VTTVSGRGVGLDAVREVVSALDGTVELKSTPGEGTTVRLEFPVTVAMAELLFVDAGAETFALPAAAVEGVHRLGDADPPSRAAVTDGGAGVTTVDGRSETTIDLREAMGAPPTSDADVSPLERAAVRIERNGEPMVLACDRVRDKREAVVDPFDDLLAGVSGVSGTTVSSDGRIVTVIDIDTL
jgi:two-component system chemotaxis sensor kinase CheA